MKLSLMYWENKAKLRTLGPTSTRTLVSCSNTSVWRNTNTTPSCSVFPEPLVSCLVWFGTELWVFLLRDLSPSLLNGSRPTWLRRTSLIPTTSKSDPVESVSESMCNSFSRYTTTTKYIILNTNDLYIFTIFDVHRVQSKVSDASFLDLVSVFAFFIFFFLSSPSPSSIPSSAFRFLATFFLGSCSTWSDNCLWSDLFRRAHNSTLENCYFTAILMLALYAYSSGLIVVLFACLANCSRSSATTPGDSNYFAATAQLQVK